MIRSRVLNLLDLVRVRANRLEHAAHSTNKANLLLKNLHAVPLSRRGLLLFVLFVLLLLEDSLHVFSDLDALLAGQRMSSTFLH